MTHSRTRALTILLHSMLENASKRAKPDEEDDSQPSKRVCRRDCDKVRSVVGPLPSICSHYTYFPEP